MSIWKRNTITSRSSHYICFFLSCSSLASFGFTCQISITCLVEMLVPGRYPLFKLLEFGSWKSHEFGLFISCADLRPDTWAPAGHLLLQMGSLHVYMQVLTESFSRKCALKHEAEQGNSWRGAGTHLVYTAAVGDRNFFKISISQLLSFL